MRFQPEALREIERRRTQLQRGVRRQVRSRNRSIAAALRNAAEVLTGALESLRRHGSRLKRLALQRQHGARSAIAGYAAVDRCERFQQALGLPAAAELEQDARLGLDQPRLRGDRLEARIGARRGDQVQRIGVA